MSSLQIISLKAVLGTHLTLSNHQKRRTAVVQAQEIMVKVTTNDASCSLITTSYPCEAIFLRGFYNIHKIGRLYTDFDYLEILPLLQIPSLDLYRGTV